MNLTTHTYNQLETQKLKVVIDIITEGLEGLKKIERIGRESYLEIVDKIHELGLTFFDETEDNLKEIEKLRKKKILRKK